MRKFELKLDKNWLRGPTYKNWVHKKVCKYFPKWFKPTSYGDELVSGDGIKIVVLEGVTHESAIRYIIPGEVLIYGEIVEEGYKYTVECE